MSEDLLKTLEDKVQNAVEIIELLKEENAELKEENTSLKEARLEWEEKLAHLIGQFDKLEEVVVAENIDSTDHSQEEALEEEEDSIEDSDSNEHSFSA